MFSIKNKKIILIPSIIFLIIILALGLKFIGKEGFPRTDEGQFMIMATMPIGTKSEQTASFVSLMEKDIKEIIKNDLKRFQSRIRTGSESSSANIRVELKSKKNRKIKNINEYIEIIRDKLLIYPCTINIWSLDSMRGDRNRGEFLRIELLTDDLIKAEELGNRIVKEVSNISGIQYVWLEEDNSNKELQIFVNRDVAAKMGLRVNDIAKIINTSFAGSTATTITPENSDWTDIDVNVQLENSDKVTIEDVKKISVPVNGVLIPLSSIADIVKSYGPRMIERKDRKRVTTVYANIDGKPLNEVMAEIKYKMNNQIFVPAGISINYAGDFEDMNEAFNQLILALILALVLVYSIMASQFESFIAPLIIALAVPFGLAGSLIALFISKTTLSAYSAIGCVVLVGIVVNNGIVLIDYMNQLMREKNINGDEAALESGNRRLRPILMTTLTTILGILPMALGSQSGNEMYKPLSIALLGGLSISTIFTLVIVPTIYGAIRNKIPLKDYDKKDFESKKDFIK